MENMTELKLQAARGAAQSILHMADDLTEFVRNPDKDFRDRSKALGQVNDIRRGACLILATSEAPVNEHGGFDATMVSAQLDALLSGQAQVVGTEQLRQLLCLVSKAEVVVGAELAVRLRTGVEPAAA